MSMAVESPSPSMSSGSSDDFAAFLESELADDTSPETSVFEAAVEKDDDGSRMKRQRVDPSDIVKVADDISSAVKDIVDPGSSIDGSMSMCPPHPGYFKGLCVKCGQLEEDGSGIALSYIHKDLKIDTSEIDRLRASDLKKLLREKKLILILDLDHTLLNSTRLIDVTAEEQYLLREADDASKDDPERSLFRLDSMHMLTKLRPFVRTFLKEASNLFDMYIYTMAERSYALEIAKILDPENGYFSSKVISQSDSTQRHQKGLDVVLGAESVVLILDDTEYVWQKHKENLILMERYHFFTSSCRQFGSSVKSLSELGKDENKTDGALATVLKVLKRAHTTFFDQAVGEDLISRDVRQVIQTIRREILQGCKVIFSRVFPSKSHAEEQHIWKIAEQLGAVCCTELDSSVTHVVALDRGTEKSRWAVMNQKFLVSPRWIEAANYLWCRQKESDFPVLAREDAKKGE